MYIYTHISIYIYIYIPIYIHIYVCVEREILISCQSLLDGDALVLFLHWTSIIISSMLLRV